MTVSIDNAGGTALRLLKGARTLDQIHITNPNEVDMFCYLYDKATVGEVVFGTTERAAKIPVAAGVVDGADTFVGTGGRSWTPGLVFENGVIVIIRDAANGNPAENLSVDANS
jgi:hypothetical protein